MILGPDNQFRRFWVQTVNFCDLGCRLSISPILDAPVDIEELEVGMSSSVQVLQFGNDAPTIIFVSDDLEGAQ